MAKTWEQEKAYCERRSTELAREMESAIATLDADKFRRAYGAAARRRGAWGESSGRSFTGVSLLLQAITEREAAGMIHDVHMSCGHFQQLDLATTGKQLKIDLDYYNRQGLCADCWAKLRARREAERAEPQARRQRKHTGGYHV